MLYTIGSKRILEELLSQGPVSKIHQGEIFEARAKADDAIAMRGAQIRVYCPGVGYVYVEAAVFGVEASSRDTTCVNEIGGLRLRGAGHLIVLLEDHDDGEAATEA